MKIKKYKGKKLSIIMLALCLGLGYSNIALAGYTAGGAKGDTVQGGIAIDGGQKYIHAYVQTEYSIAIGDNNTNPGANAGNNGGNGYIIAMGRGVTSTYQGNIVLGDRAVANVGQGNVTNDWNNALSIGYMASTHSEKSIAVGSEADSGNGRNAIALGHKTVLSRLNGSTTGAESSMSIGAGATVNGTYDIAMGTGATTGSTKDSYNAVAIGHNATVNNAAGKSDATGIALGNNAASEYMDTAIGSGATNTGAYAFALGTSANTSKDYALALGANSSVTFANAVALGAGSATTDANTGTSTQKITLSGTTYNFYGLANSTNGTVSVGKSGAARQLQNVAAGDVSATSTDAVNGSQLYALSNEVKSAADNGFTVAGDTDTTGSNVSLGSKLTIKGNGNTDTTGYSTGNVMTSAAASADGAKVTVYLSDTPTYTSVNAGTFTTSGTHAVTVSGATGTITGLANTTWNNGAPDGYADDRAATEDELKTAISNATTTENDGGINIIGDTNATGDTVKLGKKLAIKGNGATSTTGYSTANIMTKETADGANGSVVTVYMSDTPVFDSVAAGTFSTSGANTVTISGATGTITGLTNTNWNNGAPTNYSADRVATEDELQSLHTSLTSKLGGLDYAKANNSTITTAASAGTNAAAFGHGSHASGTNSTAVGNSAVATTADSVALGANSVTSVAHTGTSATQGTITGTDGNTTTQQYAGAATSTTGTVSVGSAGAERQLQNVAAGDISSTSTDAVNGSQLWTTNQNVGNLSTLVGSIEKTVGAETTAVNSLKNAVNNGAILNANSGTHDTGLGTQMNITGGGTKADSEYSATNIKTSVDGNTLTIKMDDNPTFSSVTTGSGVNEVLVGNGGINVGGKTYVSARGLNANNQKITNVAAGEVSATSTDAINGSQLSKSVNELYDMDVISNEGTELVDDLSSRVNKVAAGAAAISSLHPLDYDPHYKWDIAAGYGGYRSAQAAAVGVFYRPSRNFMISLGSTVGYENNVYTLGLTYNFGAPSRHKQIGTANDLRKALSSLLAKNKSLRSQTNDYDTQISHLRNKRQHMDMEIQELQGELATLLQRK
jgi:autotransporter adhesin